MKITVESTPEFVTVEGEGLKEARLWRGHTEHGAEVVALIGRVGIDDRAAPEVARAESELVDAPTTVVVEPAAPGDEPVTDTESAAKAALDLLTRVSEALIVSDGLTPDMSDPFHCAVSRIRKIFAGKPRPAPSAPPPPSWLVKDFWTLYQSAKALADACNGRGDGRPHPPLVALEGQLARLRPAFDVCEAERRGEPPERLTDAERSGLTALHRWLHSPSGDCDLIAAAQPYHDQVEREEPGSCAQLEAEEKATRSSTLGGRAVELVSRAEQVLAREGALPGSRPPEPHASPACTSVDPSPPPPLSTAIIDKILDDPRASAEGIDPDAAARFLAHALRGASMGWHARLAHRRDEWPTIAELAAPPASDEQRRAGWLFGFDAATTTEPEIVFVGEIEPPLVLTPELREYARRLRYRAPEQKSERDNAILAAVDAEEAARYELPEHWPMVTGLVTPPPKGKGEPS
jgi:hypothetical protein